jgi:hypothetical protein
MSADYVHGVPRRVLPLLTAQGFTFFESVNEAHATKSCRRRFTLDFTPNDDAPAAADSRSLPESRVVRHCDFHRARY